VLPAISVAMPAKILVVDDTPLLVDLVRDLLTVEGYKVATCLLARQAYPMVQRFKPDLVVLDIVMPEVSGWEVLDRIRSDPELQHIPIVICTAWAEQAAGRMLELRLPDLWLVPKPFESADLTETVAEALDRLGRADGGRRTADEAR
jgi:CheY-like chemotaxis protein